MLARPRQSSGAVLTVACLSLVACASDGAAPRAERDLGTHAVAGKDDAGAGDAQTQAPTERNPDAALVDASRAGEPVRFDAGLSDTAEAGLTCSESCHPSSPCSEARCVDGACVERALPDGASCSDDGLRVCSFGACIVPTGCGDGYREPSTEACDDGNDASDDACTPTCALRTFELSFPEADDAPSEPRALGVDDHGRVLLVAASFGHTSTKLWAQRLSARLARDGAPWLLAELPSDFEIDASVVGLASGWAVAFTWPDDGDGAGARVVRVSDDGTTDTPRSLHASARGEQRSPRVARSDQGFVAIWLERLDAANGPASTLVARFFSDAAAPRGDAMVLWDGGTSLSEPALSTTGATHVASFVELSPEPGARPTVSALAFSRDTMATLRSKRISVDDGYSPALAVGGDAALLVYSTRASDPDGDVVMRSWSLADDSLAQPELVSGAPDLVETEPQALAWSPEAFAVLFATGNVGSLDLELSSNGVHVSRFTAEVLPSLRANGTQRSGRLVSVHGGLLLAYAGEVPRHAGPGLLSVRALFVPLDP